MSDQKQQPDIIRETVQFIIVKEIGKKTTRTDLVYEYPAVPKIPFSENVLLM